MLNVHSYKQAKHPLWQPSTYMTILIKKTAINTYTKHRLVHQRTTSFSCVTMIPMSGIAMTCSITTRNCTSAFLCRRWLCWFVWKCWSGCDRLLNVSDVCGPPRRANVYFTHQLNLRKLILWNSFVVSVRFLECRYRSEWPGVLNLSSCLFSMLIELSSRWFQYELRDVLRMLQQ